MPEQKFEYVLTVQRRPTNPNNTDACNARDMGRYNQSVFPPFVIESAMLSVVLQENEFQSLKKSVIETF